MKKSLSLSCSLFLAVILALSILLACAPSPAIQPSPKTQATPPPAKVEPIELKAVSNFPPKQDTSYFLGLFTERVNQRSMGAMTVKYLGGPEVIPLMNQSEAVRAGIIDINLASTGLNISQVPEGDALYVSRVSMTDEVKRGFNAYMDEQYKKKLNLHYLGRGFDHSGFIMFTKKPVEKPKDLAGRKVRSLAAADQFALALGAVPITIETAEAYSALERGVVDTFAGTITTFDQSRLYEVLNYAIDHPYYRPSVALVINLNTWNKLSKNLQDIIAGVASEFATTDMPVWTKDKENKSRQVAISKGTKFITFSADDAKWYLDLAYYSKWAELQRKIPAESYDKMKKCWNSQDLLGVSE